MKITTNFVPSITRLVLPMAGISWALVAVLMVVGLWLAHAVIGARHEMPALRARLVQLEARQRELTTPERPPPVAELEDLKRRVAALNTLSGSRGRSVTSLLTDLEGWLPDQAWLVSLHARAKEGEVLLVAESGSVEPLTVFLLRLEQEPRFSEVLLVKQTPQGAERKTVQFEIRLKDRT